MSVQQARRESAMAVTALLVLCSLVLASAQSWPQWRGPLRTGAATTFEVTGAVARSIDTSVEGASR